MDDIKRQFEFIDKEDIIKKVVTVTFGRFLDYYKDAPEIVKPGVKGARREHDGAAKEKRGRGAKPEAGYTRLFINLGKMDGFYPGEVMQFINHHVHGRQEVGHIDLLARQSYIEVPQDDARRVMNTLDGTVYKGRRVRCNDANESRPREDRKGDARRQSRQGKPSWGNRDDKSRRPGKQDREYRSRRTAGVPMYSDAGAKRQYKKDDWKELMRGNRDVKLQGEAPDFSEEGWARRYPKKR